MSQPLHGALAAAVFAIGLWACAARAGDAPPPAQPTIAPYSSEWFAVYSTNIVNGPWRQAVEKQLTPEQQGVARHIHYKVERRSIGLPAECSRPSRLAYTEKQDSEYFIHICSNNLVEFNQFLSSYASIAFLDKELIDGDIFDSYTWYFVDIVERQRLNMDNYATIIEYPCEYLQFYWIYKNIEDSDNCNVGQRQADFNKWYSAKALPTAQGVALARATLKAMHTPGAEALNDYQAMVVAQRQTSQFVILSLLEFVMMHETGHVFHGDLESDPTECDIARQERAADSFASGILARADLFDSDDIDGLTMSWVVYSAYIIGNEDARPHVNDVLSLRGRAALISMLKALDEMSRDPAYKNNDTVRLLTTMRPQVDKALGEMNASRQRCGAAQPPPSRRP